MKGRRNPPELIDAVRRCALAGMTSGSTAAHLGLTRNAASGIADRNGIHFGLKRRIARPAPAVLPPKELKPQTSFGTVQARMGLKKPPVQCSWVGCLQNAVEGDMFCHPHGKKGLL